MLQEALLGFLSARGIDASLASFILAYGTQKEQQEYLRWLKDLSDWVTAGTALSSSSDTSAPQQQQQQQQQQDRPQQWQLWWEKSDHFTSWSVTSFPLARCLPSLLSSLSLRDVSSILRQDRAWTPNLLCRDKKRERERSREREVTWRRGEGKETETRERWKGETEWRSKDPEQGTRGGEGRKRARWPTRMERERLMRVGCLQSHPWHSAWTKESSQQTND